MQKGIKNLGDSYLSTQKHFLQNYVMDVIDLHFKNICRNNAVLNKFKIKIIKTVGRPPMPTEKEQMSFIQGSVKSSDTGIIQFGDTLNLQ